MMSQADTVGAGECLNKYLKKFNDTMNSMLKAIEDFDKMTNGNKEDTAVEYMTKDIKKQLNRYRKEHQESQEKVTELLHSDKLCLYREYEVRKEATGFIWTWVHLTQYLPKQDWDSCA